MRIVKCRECKQPKPAGQPCNVADCTSRERPTYNARRVGVKLHNYRDIATREHYGPGLTPAGGRELVW